MGTDQKIDQAELTEAERAARIRTLLKSEPLPMIQKSIETFRRDLPEMLKKHGGLWVAYHGDERIGFGKTQTELVQECLRRGLSRDDFVVCVVEEGVFAPNEEIAVSADI